MKLCEVLTGNLIRIPLQSFEKKEIITELVDILSSNGKLDDRDKVLQAVLERETMMSTGIGNGVAIPHGKSQGVPELAVALGITSQDVNFDSLDGRPVRIVFMLVGPEKASSLHIKMLSRISRLLNQPAFRKRLTESTSGQEIIDTIREEERLLESH
ncbi:MAG: PTS sugar transporter subunit IIA [Bacteroidetes bacterium]|nr:PTS sugar transporter subunit IIA [Bacteroidota bacterium]